MFAGCRFAVILSVTGLLTLSASTNVARAIAIPKPTGTHIGEHVMVAELKATRALLEKADHDYQGHRAKAVHDITQAIHELEHHHHHHATTATSAVHHTKPHAKKSGKMTEPQVVSDAQLRQAIQQITVVEGQLGTHHAKVKSHLQAAVVELNIALKIK